MANKNVIAGKEAQVNDLAEHMKGAKLILLVDYRGTTVEDDTKLRKELREANGMCKITKNNIIKRYLLRYFMILMNALLNQKII